MWEIANSPVAVTVLSFLLGGIIATIISFALQRRAHKQSLRLSQAQEIVTTYHEYIRFLRRPETVDDLKEFDRLHVDMLAKTKISRVIFDDEVSAKLKSLSDKLQNVQNLRGQGNTKAAELKCSDAFKDASVLIELMFRRL